MKYNQLTRSSQQWNEEEDPLYWEKSYNENTYPGHKLRSREKKVLQYLDSLNLKKESKILELGYGAGVTSAKIYSRGFNITGIDISNNFRDLAAKNCKKVKAKDNKSKFKFIVGNAEKLEFKDNRFDCVIGIGFIHYLEDPDKCLKEVYRILKPGGYFIISQRNMYGINKLDGPLKIIRTLPYILVNRKYELRWQDTALIYPIITFVTIASFFSNSMKGLKLKLTKHRKMGEIRKIALSFTRLKEMIEASELKIIRYDGAGYLTKKLIILLPRQVSQKLDDYFQRLSDTRKISGMYKFGNSVIFLSQKP